MFEVLVESSAPSTAALAPRLTSFAIHTSLIALAAVGVNKAAHTQPLKPVAVPIDIYVSPNTEETSATSVGSAIRGVVLGAPPAAPTDVPSVIPPVGGPIATPLVRPSAKEIAGRELFSTGTGSVESPGTSVLLAGEVDEPVVVLVPARLLYPSALAAAGIAGEVRMEFVVDTAGRCEASSVRVVSSSNPAFESSARRAVCEAVYRPGRVRGQPVRQLVQQKVAFRQR